MNLPNYFIADLPPGTPLGPELLKQACQNLKRNRAEFLLARSTQSLIQVFHELSRSWLNPEFPLRRRAIELGPSQIGFSQATLAAGLDRFFGQLTGDNLERLILQDLGHIQRLDEFVVTPDSQPSQRQALALGSELILHICAGNIPDPALLSIVLGFLTRSAQIVKCASGTALLPRLLAHSLYETEPKLGACLEIVEWPGGNELLESAIFEEADCITATGSDTTLTSIRRRLPAKARFVGYGHRLSFGYIAQEALTGSRLTALADQAAADVAAWNQLGCLSPHVLYVENGSRVSPEQFAETLANELAKREAIEPRGPLLPESAAAIATHRGFYEVRAAHSPDTRHWFSQDSTAWTVIFESDAQFRKSCLNRFIYVKSVSNLAAALQGADSIREQVSTVGLAATEPRAREIALQLAQWGVRRICPIGQMQSPPLSWRHDGRPALGDLVTWTDWER